MTAAIAAAVILNQAAASPSSPLALAQAPAQPAAPDKPTLKKTDYEQWERLGSGIGSRDGRWYAGSVSKGDGSSLLTLKSIDGPEKWTYPNTSGGQFSRDSAWFACTIGFSRSQQEQMREQRKRPEPKLSVRRLPGGEEQVFDSVATWSFSRDGRYLAILSLPPAPSGGPGGPPPAPTGGSDFQLIELSSGRSLPLTGVSTFRFSDLGPLAVQISTSGGQKGIQVIDPVNFSITNLAWGKADLRGMTWARKAATLGWLEGYKKEGREGDGHKVVVVSGLLGEKTTTVFDPAKWEGFPADHRVVETGGLQLTEDGSRALFGVRLWEEPDKPGPKPDKLTNVEIWHSKDAIVMPLQKTQAGQERTRFSFASWRITDKSFKVFTKPEDDSVAVGEGHDWAVALDEKRHASAAKVNGIEHSDIIAINVRTGERKIAAEKVVSNVGGLGSGTLSFSPSGRHMAWFDQGAWWLYDQSTGAKKSMTSSQKVVWSDEDDDRTLPQAGAASFPRWVKGEGSVILSDGYDLFLYRLSSGSLERMTSLRKDRVIARPLDWDTDEDGLAVTDPLYLSLFDRDSKASGFGVWTAKEGFKPLSVDNAQLGFARRLGETDRLLFRIESFDKSPTDYVTNLSFSAAKPVMRTNLQQEKFAWPRNELIQYKNEKGKDLQGILTYPANYKPGRFYPMVVYIYETLSDGLHSYEIPDGRNYYDTAHFAQNGYFVLQPDITYQRRNPGLSAVDCIEAAVRASLKKKVGIDAAKLGLMGHSWGAYQAVFVATKSKLFSAYVAGAPLTELIAMYSGFYFNWGQANQVIFESSQGRFDVPFWQDRKAYEANSPLHQAEGIKAPLLVEAGTVDGAVDWTQSQFLYNTMRRMGKDMVLLVYPDENHGLGREPNQRDFAYRMQHFFDVHLKGAKPEKWLKEGISYIEHDKERARTAKP